MELSLCMIVRNEQEHLPRCLDSVKAAMDEIVIVDTGSKDATCDVARRYTDRVYDYAWRDDFAHARNQAFSYATKPYLMWMDADDIMEEEDLARLIDLKSALNGRIDAVMMPYISGRRSDGAPLLSYDRERIVRAGANFRFAGAVHEAMSVSGCVVREEIAVRHLGRKNAAGGKRNLAIYRRQIESGAELAPRDWYYYARELMEDGQFKEAEAVFARATGMNLWRENRIDAHVQRAACLQALGRSGEARAELYSAVAIDAPRAETLCALGELEMNAGRDEAALFWYRAALNCAQETPGGAFSRPDCRDYIPAMQLCVLLDRMGRTKEAAQANERALIARPGDGAALFNRRYFQEKLEGKKEGGSSLRRQE